MATSNVLILNSGGIRSLVATALMAAENSRIVSMHVDDGRPSSYYARDAFKRQCDAYKITDIHHFQMQHVAKVTRRYQDSPLKMQRSSYGFASMLTCAMDAALESKCERVIWPIQVGEDFRALARVTETVELIEQISEITRHKPLRIDTPFIEMENSNIVLLGQQLDVDWNHTRTCREEDDVACGLCEWCKARAAIFRELAIDDPLPIQAPPQTDESDDTDIQRTTDADSSNA